jgi:hypothetical protein
LTEDRQSQRIQIALSDGGVVLCTPVEVGSAIAPKQWRWRLVDSSGREYVGPMYIEGTSKSEMIIRLISWWEAKTELERLASKSPG